MIETISAKRSKSEPTLKIEISEKIMELPLEERKFKNGWSSKPFERNNTIKGKQNLFISSENWNQPNGVLKI